MLRGIKETTLNIFKEKVKKAVLGDRFFVASFLTGDVLKKKMHGKSKVWELFLQEIAMETHNIKTNQSNYVKHFERYVENIGKFIITDEFQVNFLVESKTILQNNLVFLFFHFCGETKKYIKKSHAESSG